MYIFLINKLILNLILCFKKVAKGAYLSWVTSSLLQHLVIVWELKTLIIEVLKVEFFPILVHVHLKSLKSPGVLLYFPLHNLPYIINRRLVGTAHRPVQYLWFFNSKPCWCSRMWLGNIFLKYAGMSLIKPARSKCSSKTCMYCSALMCTDVQVIL